MSVIGIDLGTTGVRASAFSLDGQELATAAVGLNLFRLAPGRVEIDGQELIAAAEMTVNRVAAQAAISHDPAEAISFSVLGEAVVPVNDTGTPLAPIVLSMDNRGIAPSERLAKFFTAERFKQITGQPLHGMFAAFKIAAGEGVWRSAQAFRCVGDLLVQRWCGEAVIDFAAAARTGLFDVNNSIWSTDLLTAMAAQAPWLSRAKLSRVVPGGEIAGILNIAAAKRLGLDDGLPVIAGTHDQAAAYLGAGGLPGKYSVISFGSSDCLTFGSIKRPDGITETGFASYRIDRNIWVTLAGTAAGGWVLQWFASLLRRDLDEIFADLSLNPPALLMLPYLSGSGTLDNDPLARGLIHGLTLETTAEEIARAVVEAAGFEFAKIIAALSEHGVQIGELRVTGSGTENHAALAARANAVGSALIPVGRDAAVRGAAMLAARGIGYDPAPLAAHPLNNFAQVPAQHWTPWYEKQRLAYTELFPAAHKVTTHLNTQPYPPGEILQKS